MKKFAKFDFFLYLCAEICAICMITNVMNTLQTIKFKI